MSAHVSSGAAPERKVPPTSVRGAAMRGVVARPGREAVEAKGWLRAHKWLLLRRASQLGILALFLVGPWLGWWIVKGNLSSSLTLGVLPLTDPFLVAQQLAAGQWPYQEALLGAGIVLAFYLLFGGRLFCAWVGEAGVRLYSAGQPGGARADRLLYQARLALDDEARLNVVREMYRRRFGEEPPQRRSVEQLRGIEGSRVRAMYKLLAGQYGVKWEGRNYDPKDWDAADPINRCLSAANHCLYGVVEAAVLAAGYAPAIGFIHSGKPLSFVYDIADLYKFDTVVPAAFAVAAKSSGGNDERTVRQACRDMFRRSKLLERIIPDIEDILAAGGLDVPQIEGVVDAAIPEEKGIGDAGHRA